MLGDYIKRLTDKGYKLSFENPIEDVDWMCIKISKNGFSLINCARISTARFRLA